MVYSIQSKNCSRILCKKWVWFGKSGQGRKFPSSATQIKEKFCIQILIGREMGVLYVHELLVMVHVDFHPVVRGRE